MFNIFHSLYPLVIVHMPTCIQIIMIYQRTLDLSSLCLCFDFHSHVIPTQCKEEPAIYWDPPWAPRHVLKTPRCGLASSMKTASSSSTIWQVCPFPIALTKGSKFAWLFVLQIRTASRMCKSITWQAEDLTFPVYLYKSTLAL